MKLTKNQRLLILVAIILGGGMGIYFIGDYVGLWTGGPAVEVTPTELTTSTFTTLSSISGDDVSNFVEMDIWVPKADATFDEGYEDITALTTNFEREETNSDADDISIDLRDYDYVWAEITGNTVFDNTFYLLIGGMNYDYLFYVHDRTSDINFNILNSTMDSITIPGQATNDNYTAILNAPGYTITDNHYGDIGWDLTNTEFDELSAREKEVVWDETEWMDQYPVYVPTDDTNNNYDRDFEKITNAPALKFTFNATINITDGATTQINCTIGRGYPIETLISGANLYMVWYEGFDFNPDPYTFEFEMWFGSAINVTTVESGRANIFGSFSSLTWAETYSTIGT